MQSLKDKFDEVCLRVRNGRRLENTGSTPIYYLVFPAKQIIEVKQQTKTWIAKLENNDWNVVVLSFAEAVNSILRGHKFRKTWLQGEQALLSRATAAIPQSAVAEITTTLRKALTEGPELLSMVREKLDEAASKPNGLLLLTDLEALHPYLRINTIEARIMDQIRCPVVVLYPGKREGKTSLRFLEFYPADPNYRSEHID
jgi:type IV secretory pathway VirJ component